MLRAIQLIGIILCLCGVAFSYFGGIRAVQAGRRIANYLSRRIYERKARQSFGLSALFLFFAITLVLSRQLGTPESSAIRIPALSTETILPAFANPAFTSTPTLIQDEPTPIAETPSPALQTNEPVSSLPKIPENIQKRFHASITPAFDARIGGLRFATEVNNSQPVGPSTSFLNPIKKMYAVFSYARMLPGTQWTVLWYLDGELVHFETKIWQDEESGLGFALFEQSPYKWQPGQYEVQIYVGTQFKISGAFTLTGAPSTITPTPTATTAATPTGAP